VAKILFNRFRRRIFFMILERVMNGSQRRTNSRSAFTLIELLVVIPSSHPAALLLPVLAPRQGKGARCQLQIQSQTVGHRLDDLHGQHAGSFSSGMSASRIAAMGAGAFKFLYKNTRPAALPSAIGPTPDPDIGYGGPRER